MATAMNTTITKSSTGYLDNVFIVCQKYRLIKKFGNGAFGDIYTAINLKNGDEVAAKLEKADTKSPQLKHEAAVYGALKHGDGFPTFRYFGTEHGYNIIIMDMLGENLESLFHYCGCRFSLKTVLMLSEEMINRLEFVHEKNFIHRDIKPENFVMGNGSDRNKLFLIDFGLAKKYRYGPGGSHHIGYRTDRALTGTARYCSINAHSGIEQSRRDDMESLAYVLLYFLRGSLPWQGVRAARPKQKYEMIYEIKYCTSLKSLCQDLPKAFHDFLEYCRNLTFEEKPNYQLLREEFGKLFKQRGFQRDFLYDWAILRYQNAQATDANNNVNRPMPGYPSWLGQATQATTAQQQRQPPKMPGHPPGFNPFVNL